MTTAFTAPAYDHALTVLSGPDTGLAQMLAPVGFADWQAAGSALRRLAAEGNGHPFLAACLPDLLRELTNAAQPDRALVRLERLAARVPDRAALLRLLASDPLALKMLISLFSGSQFLSDVLIRHPAYLDWLTNRKRLTELTSVASYFAALQAALAETDADPLDTLRRFQRPELLRIGVCDLLGLWDLPTVTARLAHLADSLVRTALLLASQQTGIATDGFAILGMGKLGGGELNYSSDIDLVFIADSDAMGRRKLGERVIDNLTRMTGEGFLYRVDMRLRPWGQSGDLIVALPGYLAYLDEHARQWEKQALLKARVVAGDMALGSRFLSAAESAIYASSPSEVRAAVRDMKQRVEERLRQRGEAGREVKWGKGAIRDVEFVTQYLQRVHGTQWPEVRSRNTLDALGRLHACGLLPADEHRTLTNGYIFLRTVEHRLQMMHNLQTHVLPEDETELTHVAQRLDFQGSRARDTFLSYFHQHTTEIRAIYERHLLADGQRAARRAAPAASAPTPRDVSPHLARMAPSYATTFSDADIARHESLIAQLSDAQPVRVEALPLAERRWQLTVVGYDYLGILSIICGLLFVYQMNIIEGHIFTYEPTEDDTPAGGTSGLRQRRPHHRLQFSGQQPSPNSRRKIVDVFTVRPVTGTVSAEVWEAYEAELADLARMLRSGDPREAQAAVARRIAVTVRQLPDALPTLLPVDIEVDNTASPRYTVLRIDAPDTVGFLYEFTNALALNGIYIGRVTVSSIGNRVHDTLYVTDAMGQKITAVARQQELRSAVVLVKHFTHLLPRSPNPESALLHFHALLGQLSRKPDWAAELASLERPEVLHALAQLLGVSDFLWDDFLRMQHENLFPLVRDVDALAAPRPKDALKRELADALAACTDEAACRSALNAFKDREMFRIDMRHIQGRITDFGQFSEELTALAEVVIDAAYRLRDQRLRQQYGMPLLADGRPCPLAVCALGKCGGRELGFASDIELMFIFEGNGETAGPQVITTAEYYEKVVQEVLQTVQARREGIFQIDLRLRPHGNAGSVAVALASFRRYFGPGGAAWAYERQALVKLRAIAGDAALGAEVEQLRDEFVYTGEPFDVPAMRAMRERQLNHLVGVGTLNAKFSAGGLVDLEYIVQGLQITHGRAHPSVRQTNTRAALAALADAGVLSAAERRALQEAHIFLRLLIDALRVVRGNAKDLTVPQPDTDEFAFLARRLHYSHDVASLREDIERHTAAVRQLSQRLLDAVETRPA